MKYNEQYLLNLSLQLIRHFRITTFDLMVRKELNLGQGWYSPRWFCYYTAYDHGPFHNNNIKMYVDVMKAGTRGFIAALGISEATSYRQVPLEEVLCDDDNLPACSAGRNGNEHLTEYAVAVIMACMWEMLATEHLLTGYGKVPRSSPGISYHYKPTESMTAFANRYLVGVVRGIG